LENALAYIGVQVGIRSRLMNGDFWTKPTWNNRGTTFFSVNKSKVWNINPNSWYVEYELKTYN